MVRISDARMSGTAFGAIVLHITPESAIGGPLALVQNGDRIRLDVAGAPARTAGVATRNSRRGASSGKRRSARKDDDARLPQALSSTRCTQADQRLRLRFSLYTGYNPHTAHTVTNLGKRHARYFFCFDNLR